MPRVTFRHVFPATYIQAPVSTLTPSRPAWVGTVGMLCVLHVRYGSDESRDRQICVFLSDRASFITDPGLVKREGDALTHVYRTTPTVGILREPLRDDLSGEYMNVWRLTGPEVCDSQERADFLEIIKKQWRVLRRTEMEE
ncbi:MAG: hypothetical protein IKG18_08710 [Atopobiaceae bacterium]|nr:hypothetical protein [Atopobiaceae bacterium]